MEEIEDITIQAIKEIIADIVIQDELTREDKLTTAEHLILKNYKKGSEKYKKMLAYTREEINKYYKADAEEDILKDEITDYLRPKHF